MTVESLDCFEVSAEHSLVPTQYQNLFLCVSGWGGGGEVECARACVCLFVCVCVRLLATSGA